MDDPRSTDNLAPMNDSNTSSNVITTPSKILQELLLSKENGNVVGIWAASLAKISHKVVCLTAVENIIDVEITEDKLIILKKIDLQGVYLNNNEIYLSEVEKIITFTASYNDHLLSYLQQAPVNPMVKIRKRQQVITHEDLKMILIRNLNSGNKINIRKTDEQTAQPYYIRDFNPYVNVALVASMIDSEPDRYINVNEIAEIEFEFSYDYKGFSSRIFKTG